MARLKGKKVVKPIRDINRGNTVTRFLCKNTRKCQTTPDKDLLALHLGFYLASWGMYRGSSFLLQRDYKTHIPVVEKIMKEDYDLLWEFDPSNVDNIDKALNLLFGEDGNSGLNDSLKKEYGDTTSEEAEGKEVKSSAAQSEAQREATETLITKFLMGTFACVPAFDRFLRKGIGSQKEAAANDSSLPEASLANYLSYSGEKITQSYTKETCKTLMNFVNVKEEKSRIFSQAGNGIFYYNDKKYPPMKLLDMYLWEIGYELDQVTILKEQQK